MVVKPRDEGVGSGGIGGVGLPVAVRTEDERMVVGNGGFFGPRSDVRNEDFSMRGWALETKAPPNPSPR